MPFPPTSPLTKVNSNITQLAYALETSTAIGVLPASSTQTWVVQEPNSYKSVGGKIKTVARQPINPSRQLRKGALVDIDGSVGYVADFTQINMQDLLQGFFFASFNRKHEYSNSPIIGLLPTIGISTVSSGNTINFTGSTALNAGDLIFTNGFTNMANNGLQVINSVGGGGTSVVVNNTLTAESSVSTQSAVHVGFQFAVGDASIETSTNYPTLVTSAKNMSVFGITTGEFVFLGGDPTSTQFATTADQGFCRVYSLSSTQLQFDKTFFTMAADAGTSKTVQLFFGRVLYNQQPASIVRRTYTFENILGNNDASNPTLQQAQVLPGCVPSEFTLNLKMATKVEADLDFMGLNSYIKDESSTGANTLLSKAAVVAGGSVILPNTAQTVYNTATEIPRIKLATFTPGTTCPLPLIAYATDLAVTIKNNISPDKAVGVLGAFEMTAGTFQVSGKMTAYFSQVEAIQAVLANQNITLDFHLVQNNSGVSMDFPLITLGDAIVKVELNKPITIPLSQDMTSGNYVGTGLDHTALMVFYDYLPTLAVSV